MSDKYDFNRPSAVSLSVINILSEEVKVLVLGERIKVECRFQTVLCQTEEKCCTIQWLMARKISCNCPCDSKAEESLGEGAPLSVQYLVKRVVGFIHDMFVHCPPLQRCDFVYF